MSLDITYRLASFAIDHIYIFVFITIKGEIRQFTNLERSNNQIFIIVESNII